MAKTILEALNELVEKQGGNTEDNKLIVDALNDLVESGGGSSGGDGFTVTFTVDTIINDAEYGAEFGATCDKTAEEVITAISNGEKINLKITSLDYDEQQITSYYSVLSNFAYPQDGQYGIATLTNSNKVVGFYLVNNALVCRVYQYAELPIYRLVYTNGGVAHKSTDGSIYKGTSVQFEFDQGAQINFLINANNYRPLGIEWNARTNVATIDFVIGGVIKRYTLDDSGNFAKVV